MRSVRLAETSSIGDAAPRNCAIVGAAFPGDCWAPGEAIDTRQIAEATRTVAPTRRIKHLTKIANLSHGDHEAGTEKTDFLGGRRSLHAVFPSKSSCSPCLLRD